jgi:hypothetical protein
MIDRFVWIGCATHCWVLREQAFTGICGGWPLVEVVVGPLSRRTARDRVPCVVWGGCGFAVSLVMGPSVL